MRNQMICPIHRLILHSSVLYYIGSSPIFRSLNLPVHVLKSWRSLYLAKRVMWSMHFARIGSSAKGSIIMTFLQQYFLLKLGPCTAEQSEDKPLFPADTCDPAFRKRGKDLFISAVILTARPLSLMLGRPGRQNQNDVPLHSVVFAYNEGIGSLIKTALLGTGEAKGEINLFQGTPLGKKMSKRSLRILKCPIHFH